MKGDQWKKKAESSLFHIPTGLSTWDVKQSKPRRSAADTSAHGGWTCSMPVIAKLVLIYAAEIEKDTSWHVFCHLPVYFSPNNGDVSCRRSSLFHTPTGSPTWDVKQSKPRRSAADTSALGGWTCSMSVIAKIVLDLCCRDWKHIMTRILSFPSVIFSEQHDSMVMSAVGGLVEGLHGAPSWMAEHYNEEENWRLWTIIG